MTSRRIASLQHCFDALASDNSLERDLMLECMKDRFGNNGEESQDTLDADFRYTSQQNWKRILEKL